MVHPPEGIKIINREDGDRIRQWLSTWAGEGQADTTGITGLQASM